MSSEGSSLYGLDSGKALFQIQINDASFKDIFQKFTEQIAEQKREIDELRKELKTRPTMEEFIALCESVRQVQSGCSSTNSPSSQVPTQDTQSVHELEQKCAKLEEKVCELEMQCSDLKKELEYPWNLRQKMESAEADYQKRQAEDCKREQEEQRRAAYAELWNKERYQLKKNIGPLCAGTQVILMGSCIRDDTYRRTYYDCNGTELYHDSFLYSAPKPWKVTEEQRKSLWQRAFAPYDLFMKVR